MICHKEVEPVCQGGCLVKQVEITVSVHYIIPRASIIVGVYRHEYSGVNVIYSTIYI